jgi:hypothetical protein
MRFILLFVAALTAFAQAPANLMGRWRSMETSKGGIGAMFEFRGDGTLSFSPGAVVEMNYRVEGKELIFPPATTTGPEQRQKMEWVNADRVTLGGAETLSRQGAARDPANPLFGEWTAPRDMGGTKMEARYFFEPTGKVLLLLPFAWQKGTYSVTGGSIRIDRPKALPSEGAFRIEGDVLTLPGTRGNGESHFRRY